MNSKLKETLIRVIILLVGLTIAHLGVTLFLLADLGSDPFNVLIQGLLSKLSAVAALSFLTHGMVHMAVCFIIIIVLLLVYKKDSAAASDGGDQPVRYVRIGTILCMFCGGPIIDFFTWLLGPLFAGDVSLAVKILVNVLGCAILAFGMTIVIKSEAGTGPNDLVAIVIADKIKKKFSIVRVICDVCFAGIGFLLGGTVGLGTVICAFVVGPVAGVFMPMNEKAIKSIMSKCMKNEQ